MKIKKFKISNFKSIKELEIINPNPFSVFVGPNGAGKSNIFEALEFGTYLWQQKTFVGAAKFFDRIDNLLHRNHFSNKFSWMIDFDKQEFMTGETFREDGSSGWGSTGWGSSKHEFEQELKNGNPFFSIDDMNSANQFFHNFSRIFLNIGKNRILTITDTKILTDGSGLETVLKRLLQDEKKREEIVDWMQVLVPEFKNIQIESSKLSGETSYVIFEKHSDKPFSKHLISDGTKNILALLVAVYQSDEPQFLCIEEPENGLHPDAIKALTRFFRNVCEEKGHFVWLNTHSQTLVSELTVDEIIVIDKREGETRLRQFQGENLYGLRMDDAWLTNALGGGLP